MKQDTSFFEEIEQYIRQRGLVIEKNDSYRFIIGESRYPNSSNVIYPSAPSIYVMDGIGEIAFLSPTYTADIFLILSILLNSFDEAVRFIEWLLPKGKAKIADFREYLFYRCKILMFNRYDKTSNGYKNRNSLTKKLIGQYKPTKILVVGRNTTKSFDNMVAGIECRIIYSCASVLEMEV